MQDKGDPNRLCVRARKRARLERLFPEGEIIMTPHADYACRVFVTKSAFMDLLAQRIEKVDYTNFKNSVRDDRLHDLYAGFWQEHWQYQQEARH